MKIFLMLVVIHVVLACGGDVKSTLNEKVYSLKGDTTLSFTADEEGKIPNGFSATSVCSGQEIKWFVISDNGNKVVSQQAKNESGCFNLLVLDKPFYRHFVMSVKIKAIAGEEDRGGGLTWRYKDSRNYYLARYNPLENNFRFYKVVNGNRKQLESADSDIKSGEWFTMQIEMKGNKITCSLNNKKLIETTDDTFKDAGKIGLWTKADAQSYFDDLKISSLE